MDAGVRTVVDLRNDDELPATTSPRPAAVTTLRFPHDDGADDAWWADVRARRLDGTPLLFVPFLERAGPHCVDLVRLVAGAPAGGVLLHCRVGRDRTGFAVALLLALVGVLPEAIADDYARSAGELPPDEQDGVEELLRRHGTTARQGVLDALAALDVEAALRPHGLADEALAALRERLLAPSRTMEA